MDGITQATGEFKGLLGKWTVFDNNTEELGTVRSVFLSFSKKYIYNAFNREELSIHSPAFSKNHIIYDTRNNEIASFKRVNNFFASAAYEVHNSTDFFTMEELIIVVMGVNEIKKRKRRQTNANVNH